LTWAGESGLGNGVVSGCKDKLESIIDSSGDFVGRKRQLSTVAQGDDVVGSAGHRGTEEYGSEDSFHCERLWVQDEIVII